MQAESGFEAVSMGVLTRMEKWSPLEVKILVAKTTEEAKNPHIHTVFDL
jgi:hypothetical protein